MNPVSFFRDNKCLHCGNSFFYKTIRFYLYPSFIYLGSFIIDNKEVCRGVLKSEEEILSSRWANVSKKIPTEKVEIPECIKQLPEKFSLEDLSSDWFSGIFNYLQLYITFESECEGCAGAMELDSHNRHKIIYHLPYFYFCIDYKNKISNVYVNDKDIMLEVTDIPTIVDHATSLALL